MELSTIREICHQGLAKFANRIMLQGWLLRVSFITAALLREVPVPYQSKFDREKALWMTLGEAVHHVASVEADPPPGPEQPLMDEARAIVATFMKLDEPEPRFRAALQQIRWALHDGEIPFRWGSVAHAPSRIGSFQFPEPSGDFWLHAIIDWTEYTVSENDFGFLAAKPQTARWGWYVQLLKERVFQIWPANQNKLQMRRRRTADESEILARETAREIYLSSQPNIREAEQIICKSTGIGRKIVRTVLSEEEFASRRRPPGNSRARSKL